MEQAQSTQSLPALEDHLGYWLRRVSNPVSESFAKRLLQARQVTVAEWVAIRLIFAAQESGTSVTSSELVKQIGMTRGAISKVLDKLETKGWIARTTNPADSRVQWLSRTSEGSLVLPELAQLAEANEEAYFQCLTSQERDTLRALLEKLAQQHHLSTVPTE
jgi:DNA-binding MarR family transcriptional regulator